MTTITSAEYTKKYENSRHLVKCFKEERKGMKLILRGVGQHIGTNHVDF